MKPVKESDLKGAKALNKLGIGPDHPLHQAIGRVHATVKDAHPETTLTTDHLLDSFCGNGASDISFLTELMRDGSIN